VDENGKLVRRSMHWRRVSGWMRGWAPAVSVAATPNVSRAGTPADTRVRRASAAARARVSRSRGRRTRWTKQEHYWARVDTRVRGAMVQLGRRGSTVVTFTGVDLASSLHLHCIWVV
jgi:hypothetical protein